MANLIDKTYFILDINLPDSKFTDLDTYIAKYEPEVLKMLLGYELYELMITSPTVEPYKSLIEGAEYTVQHNGRSQKVKWNGFTNTEFISLIAYYVYYWYNRDKASLTNTVGEVKSKQENSYNATQASKIMNAWSRLEELYGCPGQSELIASAYNYLTEKETDFPEWIFTNLGNVNSFDL